MAHAGASAVAEPEASGQPVWQVVVATIAALLLAAIFLVSGLWKLTDPLATSERMAQMLVPRQLALLAAIGVGMCETLAGVLVLVPLWRRWGTGLCGFLLVVFMIYMGARYNALHGGGLQLLSMAEAAGGAGLLHGRRGDAAPDRAGMAMVEAVAEMGIRGGGAGGDWRICRIVLWL